MHPCVLIMLTLFCCFDFSSAYNHSAIKGIPIAKNTSIVRTGTRRTNNAIPKHKAAIPNIDIQRVVGSTITSTSYKETFALLLRQPTIMTFSLFFSLFYTLIRLHSIILVTDPHHRLWVIRMEMPMDSWLVLYNRL